MITLKFPDGNEHKYEKEVSALDVISNDIGEGLLRVAIAAKVNDKLIDLRTTITDSGDFRVITFNDTEGKEIFWHSSAHILAIAIKRIFPNAKLTIGPAIQEGFYYDIDIENALNPQDLEILESEMKKIIKENLEIKEKIVSKKEALELHKDNPYKIEMINSIEDEHVSVYFHGDDLADLCRGPHLISTGKVKAVKLLKTSGAFWKGDAKNKQLQRIYGISFPNKDDLKEYLQRLEEAAKRDHRKIGRDMDLFCFSELVGPGLPMYTPKGTIIKDELQREVEKICRRYGFQKVSCPSLANIKLFETSGHAQKFNEELFRVESLKGHKMVLKPVQCPHHTQLYSSKSRSYKDLPIRYMESDKQYRAELQGGVGGMSRVYAITVEDGHSFCRVDQVKQEVINMVNIIKDFYSSLGLWGNHWISLSVRDYESPEKYIGSTKDWDICENMLQEVSDEMNLNAKKCEGEAALYGPKLDFMFKDAMGKEIQIPTVQLDFATAKRFDLKYITKENAEESPVMVHRAILGSYERFFVLLIEHFAGKFPLWLSPVQVKILPIADRHIEYCKKVADEMKDQGIRVEINEDAETTNKKVREAQLENVNYILVVGDREVESKTVNVRTRDNLVKGEVRLETFISEIKEEIKNKNIN